MSIENSMQHFTIVMCCIWKVAFLHVRIRWLMLIALKVEELGNSMSKSMCYSGDISRIKGLKKKLPSVFKVNYYLFTLFLLIKSDAVTIIIFFVLCTLIWKCWCPLPVLWPDAPCRSWSRCCCAASRPSDLLSVLTDHHTAPPTLNNKKTVELSSPWLCAFLVSWGCRNSTSFHSIMNHYQCKMFQIWWFWNRNGCGNSHQEGQYKNSTH